MTEAVVDIDAWRCPAERPARVALLIIGSVGAVLIVLLTMGVAVIFAGVMALSYYMSLRLLRAVWLSQGARVDAEHFPHIQQAVDDVRGTLGYDKPIEVYVVEATLVNALITALLGTRFLVLFSQLVEGAEDDPEQLRALIGHEIGHVVAGHFRFHFLMLLGAWVPLLWNAWSRACEYTADRIGYACSGNLEATERLLATLSVGWRLARHVRPQKMIEQANEATGSLAARYLELTSTHPMLVKRIRALRAASTGTEAETLPEPAGITLAAGVLAIPGSYGLGGGSGLFVAVSMIVVLAAILFPVFARAREKAAQVSCLSNLKQVTLGCSMYAADWDGRLPSRQHWAESTYAYVLNRDLYRCPAEPKLGIGYEYAPYLSGSPWAQVRWPERTLLLWDAREDNLSMGRMVPAFRHGRGINAAYADGHCRWLSRPEFEELLRASEEDMSHFR